MQEHMPVMGRTTDYVNSDVRVDDAVQIKINRRFECAESKQ